MGTEHLEHERRPADDEPAARPARAARRDPTDVPSAAPPDIDSAPLRLERFPHGTGRVQRAAATAHDIAPVASADEPAAWIQRSTDAGRLPAQLRAGVERLSGVAVDDVRVQRNSSRPAQVGALAYAQGDEIHLGPGQDEHLPHEAWHIVQQRQGRVRQTLQLQSASINDDDALEHEADVMGARALAAGHGATVVAAVDAPAAPDVRPSTRGTNAAGGVMQLINAKDRNALKAIKAGVVAMTDPQARWDAIKQALDALGSGTNKNVIDGAKYLGVDVPEAPQTLPAATATLVKKRSADTEWDHITRGGTNRSGEPTGYHTINGKDAIAEGFGPKKELEFNCYQQRVRLIKDHEKIKQKPSTFFPDDWSLDDIREAIEYALPVGKHFEVMAPAKGRGMKLFKNADSWFPFFD